MSNHIKLKLIDEKVLVSFSEEVALTKKTTISVNSQYKALAYIDEKLAFRIDPCLNKNIFKEYGKDFLGKNLRIAFLLTKSMPQCAWGFGNIQVNNERLKEAYRIGANGKIAIEIFDYVKLISAFINTDQIDIDLIREKVISIIKTVGVPILSNCFANTKVSIFEINSLLSEIRQNMMNALEKEKMLSLMGIKILDITINALHPNEEDLEIIRERING